MTGLLAEAIALAAKAHRGQVDKAGEDYILHPLRVMFRIREAGHRVEVQAAAVPLCARMSETVPPPEITEEGETG